MRPATGGHPESAGNRKFINRCCPKSEDRRVCETTLCPADPNTGQQMRSSIAHGVVNCLVFYSFAALLNGCVKRDNHRIKINLHILLQIGFEYLRRGFPCPSFSLSYCESVVAGRTKAPQVHYRCITRKEERPVGWLVGQRKRRVDKCVWNLGIREREVPRDLHTVGVLECRRLSANIINHKVIFLWLLRNSIGIPVNRGLPRNDATTRI